jgi:hypothetical protein
LLLWVDQSFRGFHRGISTPAWISATSLNHES